MALTIHVSIYHIQFLYRHTMSTISKITVISIYYGIYGSIKKYYWILSGLKKEAATRIIKVDVK